MSRSRTLRLTDWEFANAHLPFPFPSDVFEVDMPDEKRPTDSVMEGHGA